MFHLFQFYLSYFQNITKLQQTLQFVLISAQKLHLVNITYSNHKHLYAVKMYAAVPITSAPPLHIIIVLMRLCNLIYHNFRMKVIQAHHMHFYQYIFQQILYKL